MDMLADILLAPSRKDAVIADLVLLVEHTVAHTGGLRGIALRTGLSMLKNARPGVLPRATERFLPEVAAALEPLWQEHRAAGGSDFAAFLQRHSRRAARALLDLADRRVQASSNPTVKKNYERFHGTAEAEVVAAIPELGQIIGKHAAAAARG